MRDPTGDLRRALAPARHCNFAAITEPAAVGELLRAIDGFRAMARTILHQRLGVKPEAIEHPLAHRVPGALGTAYNRTKFLKERRAMMEQWGDYLDRLKAWAEMIPCRTAPQRSR